MSLADVAYLGAQSRAAQTRLAALEAHKLVTAQSPGAPVTVLDGAGYDDAALDRLLADIDTGYTRILVLFDLSHGISFRARREGLLAAGAQDVMSADASDEEFLTRVRALIHLSRPPAILVVEDEDKIGDWAVDVLRDAGMDAHRVATLADAEARFQAGPIDALVVDRNLPDGDGLDFIAKLRDLGIRTPALLFTAMNNIEDRLKGLEEARANDYICKPVHADELRARVRVLLRPLVSDETLVFGPLEIGRKDRIVKWRGDRIELRRKECEMLIYLAERAGLPIPQRMIYLDVWGKVFMEIGSNPITAARHRMVRDIKAFLKVRGEDYPEFIGTDADAYVLLPDQLLQLPHQSSQG